MRNVFAILLLGVVAARAQRRDTLTEPANAAVTPKLVLYVEGVFDNSYPLVRMEAAAREIAKSGFSVAILSFLHYHDTAPPTLYYNDILFSKAIHLRKLRDILLAPNSTVKTVLLSVGGGGNDADFATIAAHWNEFNSSVTSLVHNLSLHGLDIDYEGSLEKSPRQMSIDQAIVKLLRLGEERAWVMTIAPVSTPEYWLPLLNASARKRAPPVAWVNLQTYDDGTADEPTYRAWLAGMRATFPGAPDAVLVGSDAAVTASAAAERTKVGAYLARFPVLPGAFVWDYREIALVPPLPAGTVRQYAEAIAGAYAAADVAAKTL